MPTVEETISDTYFGERTYTAEKTLYADARKKNPDVTLDDVKAWIAKNIVRTKNYKFQNSWVPKGPKEEFQMDMFEYKYKQPQKQRVRAYKFQRGKTKSKVEPYGLLAVDAFTKYCWVIPTHFKDKENIDEAMKKVFEKMGTPKVIYSDPDSGFLSDPLQELFKNSTIHHIISRLHARVAERTIRTIKGLLKIAIDKDTSGNPLWTKHINQVLDDYNNKNVHSTIGMTPAAATQGQNEFEARTNLEIHRKKFRRYPELNVGDKVRVFRKRGTFAKEDTGVWDKEPTEIARIETSPITGQTLYYVFEATVRHKPFVRSEIWKISDGPIREAPDPTEAPEPEPAPKKKEPEEYEMPADTGGASGSGIPRDAAGRPVEQPAPKAKAEPKAKAKAKAKTEKLSKDVKLAMAVLRRFGR
jgi:transposase InsO family protein